MLLQKRPTIEEQIVKLLAKKSNLSAGQILTIINSQGLDYSQRGIYKELAKLEEEGIVLKLKSSYSLHLSWVTNLLAFADSAYDSYIKSKYIEEIIALDDKKVTYTFNKVARLDLFWIHLLSAIHQVHLQEPLFLWCPYQWFHLMHDHAVKLFFEASDLSGVRRYHIIGGENYLNKKSLETLPKNGEYSLRESPFSNEMNVYYSIIGDVSITVRFDQAYNNRIEQMFAEVKSEKDLKAYDLNLVFGPNIKGRLTIERNAGKAKRFKKKFVDFFGI